MGIDQQAAGPDDGAERLPPTPFLPDWLLFHARRRPEAPAVVAGASRLTYGELAVRVQALAGDLARHGVTPGARVLVSLPNTPANIAAGLAINHLGAISVEVSRAWSAGMLEEVVARTAPRHLFVAARDGALWAGALDGRPVDHAWVVGRGRPPQAPDGPLVRLPTTAVAEDGTLEDGGGPAPGAVPPARLDADAPALILYTSGSTGRPHGVIQTFANVDANTRSIVEYLELTAADRALLALPLSYCYGRSVLQTHLLVGGSVVLDDRMVFPRRVMEAMAAEGCTGFAGVPLTFELLRRSVDLSTIPMPELRYVTQAGGAMAAETIAWAREAFAPARLFVMYGQTEATARLTYLPPSRARDKVGSIGVPIPGVELRVVDAAGVELPAGEVGEIVARGRNVTPGYFDDPEETAGILRGGWLWTGDLGELDTDGFLYHRGRAREILKVGGHRVSPVQIEEVVARHPGVAEVGVVGRPDPLMGEVPIAVVVPRPGTSVDVGELLAWCRASLPPPLVPVAIQLAASLPRNEAGKLRRSALAATVVAAGPDAARRS